MSVNLPNFGLLVRNCRVYQPSCSHTADSWYPLACDVLDTTHMRMFSLCYHIIHARFQPHSDKINGRVSESKLQMLRMLCCSGCMNVTLLALAVVRHTSIDIGTRPDPGMCASSYLEPKASHMCGCIYSDHNPPHDIVKQLRADSKLSLLK